MARAVGPFVLVFLTVLAGCGQFAGPPPEPTPRVTPVEVPTTRQQPAEFVAPGMTAERLVDAEALQRAHATTLANTSHTFRETVTRRTPNGTVLSRYVTLIARNGTTVRYRYDSDRAEGRQEEWEVDRFAEGERIYTARRSGAETRYTVEPVGAGRRVPVSPEDYTASLSRVFALLSITVDDTVRRGDRTRYYLATAEPRDVPPLRNATFAGAVTPDGVIDDYQVSYRVRDDGRPVDVLVDVSITDLGTTTVDRPDWYERARNETGQ